MSHVEAVFWGVMFYLTGIVGTLLALALWGTWNREKDLPNQHPSWPVRVAIGVITIVVIVSLYNGNAIFEAISRG